ncbi:carboxyvinyl-carboxyphosphonate phosphorylmutase protein [Mizugakiibacter sediminis]|uniref:2-methylisocitrate lyase n=1 Tax=Mizugakiibacter sediminis TaxID=1475481 RepID=A0A0K8QKN8_9GAMM|nr:methylisocitrate lyase [Mizugakiibacter sediminis]GAP65399.1 carboxyvinyl-carboxyphosphonate phosphorylmutase protein [Mizugakiibacter sediminis]
MSPVASPGARFRAAVAAEKPLQIVGAVNAYAGILAASAGFKALYVSGGGVAASSRGIPDLGITTLEDVAIDVERLTSAVDLPVLVDIDTGWGSAFNIARAIKTMIRVGAGAVHIEDQVQAKRCGHRPGKELVPKEDMADRIKAAADARSDAQFVIMARTDAIAVEGLDAAIERAQLCVEAGADMIFAEAVTELPMYRRFKDAVKVPVLANITEFGKTPLWSTAELAAVGVDMVLYPLSAFRAMAKAALGVYEAIRRDGHQRAVIDAMQTRTELYDKLGYWDYERKLDELFGSRKEG